LKGKEELGHGEHQVLVEEIVDHFSLPQVVQASMAQDQPLEVLKLS
jgi:hypothetical protein